METETKMKPRREAHLGRKGSWMRVSYKRAYQDPPRHSQKSQNRHKDLRKHPRAIKYRTEENTNAKVVSSSRSEAKKKDESQASIKGRGPSPDVAVVACCCHLKQRTPPASKLHRLSPSGLGLGSTV